MMNTASNPVKNLFLIITAFLFVLSLSACARKINFVTSNVVPAAKGTVKITKDDNENHLIKINIEHLTTPTRLQPSKKTYVVWMDSGNSGIKNLGQLKSSSGLFSTTMKGSLTTVTSFNPVKFFVTAEDNGDVRFPGTQVVLTTP